MLEPLQIQVIQRICTILDVSPAAMRYFLTLCACGPVTSQASPHETVVHALQAVYVSHLAGISCHFGLTEDSPRFNAASSESLALSSVDHSSSE